MTTNIQAWIKCAKEVERTRDVRFDCSAEREAALDALAAFASESACAHRRYTLSPNGRLRQCRDCFKTAVLEEYGWDWP